MVAVVLVVVAVVFVVVAVVEVVVAVVLVVVVVVVVVVVSCITSITSGCVSKGTSSSAIFTQLERPYLMFPACALSALT